MINAGSPLQTFDPQHQQYLISTHAHVIFHLNITVENIREVFPFQRLHNQSSNTLSHFGIGLLPQKRINQH